MKDFGFTDKMQNLVDPDSMEGLLLARVVREHKERYTIQCTSGTLSAEITGNLRFTAESRLDFPAVGDWVKAMPVDDGSAIIMEVLPRFSILQRQAIGQYGERQIIATNIDTAFVIQSTGHDFNLNRMERYLTICHGAGIEPVILLSKTDLLDSQDVKGLLARIKERIHEVRVIPVSNISGDGYKDLNKVMKPFNTYCFIGSSGVGKSSLVNGLSGQEVLKTNHISEVTAKGKHTTSHRELIILPNQSIIIDTPGMRELGMTDQHEGLDITYEAIHSLTADCRFKDCSHTNEMGCAVLDAVETGELDTAVYENYMKLQREQAYFSATIKEKREKDKKQGKLYKSIMQAKRKNRYT